MYPRPKQCPDFLPRKVAAPPYFVVIFAGRSGAQRLEKFSVWFVSSFPNSLLFRSRKDSKAVAACISLCLPLFLCPWTLPSRLFQFDFITLNITAWFSTVNLVFPLRPKSVAALTMFNTEATQSTIQFSNTFNGPYFSTWFRLFVLKADDKQLSEGLKTIECLNF